MEISKDDLFLILEKYDDRYRDDLNKTILFIDMIFDTFHRNAHYSLNKDKLSKGLK